MKIWFYFFLVVLYLIFSLLYIGKYTFYIFNVVMYIFNVVMFSMNFNYIFFSVFDRGHKTLLPADIRRGDQNKVLYIFFNRTWSSVFFESIWTRLAHHPYEVIRESSNRPTRGRKTEKVQHIPPERWLYSVQVNNSAPRKFQIHRDAEFQSRVAEHSN